MRLYHGSNVEVRNPSLRYGRHKTDFGKGFYTTTQKEQAEKWTEIKLDRAKTGKKTVSVYEVDDALLANSELRMWLVVERDKNTTMIWSLALLRTIMFSLLLIYMKVVC